MIEAKQLYNASKHAPLAQVTAKNYSTDRFHRLSRVSSPPAFPPIAKIESSNIIRVISHDSIVSNGLDKRVRRNTCCSALTPSPSSPVRARATSAANIGRTRQRSISNTSAMASHSCQGSSLEVVPEALPIQNDGNRPEKLETKTFREMYWSTGEESFEEIPESQDGKRVMLVWGKGVDEFIPEHPAASEDPCVGSTSKCPC